MTEFRRAMLYLRRRKGRTILMLILIFVMASFILLGTVLKINVSREIQDIKSKLNNSFILEPPFDDPQFRKYISDDIYTYDGPQVTDEMLESILSVEGVDDYNLQYPYSFVWADVELIPGLDANLANDPSEGMSKEQIDIETKQTFLFTCFNGELDTSFRNGSLTITEGRNITQDDRYVAVISDTLAQRNGLSVGDTIAISAMDTVLSEDGEDGYGYGVLCGDAFELEIIGLFHANFTQNNDPTYTFEGSFIENDIYTDVTSGAKCNENQISYSPVDYSDEDSEFRYNRITFFVNDPGRLDEIIQEVENLNDWDSRLVIQKDSSSYSATIKPLKYISLLSWILLGVGVIGSLIILSLLIKMNITERKREIGILLSLGISRKKIIAQFIMEYLTISAIGLVITFLMSGFMTNICSNAITAVTTPSADAETYEVSIGTDSLLPETEQISSDAVELDCDYNALEAGIIVLIVLGTSCASVLISSRQIIDIKPRELLQTL